MENANPNPQPRSATNLPDPDDLGFLYGLVRAPCFRETAMYSIGGGAALGALQLHRNRNVTKSAETMVKAGCAFALIHWVACRKRYYDEREMTYESIEAIRRRNEEAVMQRARARAKKDKEEANQGIGEGAGGKGSE